MRQLGLQEEELQSKGGSDKALKDLRNSALPSSSSATYSLDPNNPTSLGYYDGLRLLASRAVGETETTFSSLSNSDSKEEQEVGRLGYHVDATRTRIPQEISATVFGWDGKESGQEENQHHKASLVSIGTVQADGTQSGHVVHLGHLTTMVPLGMSGLHVLDWAVASLLAVHHWNNRISNVLPILGSKEVAQDCQVKFTHEYLDTVRSPREASRLLVQDVLPRLGNNKIEKPLPTALLGALRSPVTMNLAALAGIEGLPLLSHASASTSLSNPDEYPLFGRITPSSAATARAAASYFQFLGATHVGVFYWRDNWGDSYRNAFSNAAAELANQEKKPPMVIHSVPSHNQCHDTTCMEAAVKHLASRGYRYFFALIGPSAFPALMELSHKYGIAGPGRFWLMSEVFSDTTIGKFRFPKDSPLAQVTHGMGRISVGGSPKVTGNPEALHFGRAWQTLNEPEFKEHFKRQEPRLAKKMALHRVDSYDFHAVPSLYAEGLYDAVMAVGLATCHLTKERRGTDFTSKELFEQIKRTTFDGVSGRVELDHKTGSRKYESVVYSVSNVVSRDADSTGNVTFDVRETYKLEPASEVVADVHQVGGPKSGGKWTLIEGSEPFNYCDLSSTPPPSLPAPNVHVYGINTSVLVAGWTLCGILLASSVLCALWVARSQNVPVIRASQPLFLFFICGGTFLMGCAIVPLSAQPAHGVPWSLLDMACMSSWWLYSVGYILVFSALFAKTLRLNMILTGDGYRRVKVPAKDVFMPLVGLMSLNIAVLSAWTIFAPLQYAYIEGTKTDVYGRTLDLYGHCQYKTGSKIFAGALLSINATVSLIALVEAFRGRNIVSGCAESKYIFYVLTSIVEAFALGVPVVVVSWDSPSASFAVTSSLIFVTGMSTLTLLFVPKFSVAWKSRGRPVSHRAGKSMVLGPSPCIAGGNNGRPHHDMHANLKRAKKMGEDRRHSETYTCATETSRFFGDHGILETFLHGGLESFADSVDHGPAREESAESVTRAIDRLISTTASSTPPGGYARETDETGAVRVMASLFSSLFVRGNRNPVTRHSIAVFRHADIQELYDSNVTTPFEDENRERAIEMFDTSTVTVPNARVTNAVDLEGDNRGRPRLTDVGSDEVLVVSVKEPKQSSEMRIAPSRLVVDTISTAHHRHSLSVFQQDEIRSMYEESRKPLPVLV